MDTNAIAQITEDRTCPTCGEHVYSVEPLENGKTAWLCDGGHVGRFDAPADEVEDTEKFEQILDLEQHVRSAKASIQFAPIGLPQRHANAHWEHYLAAKKALAAAIDAMTPEQMAAFGTYRAAWLENLPLRPRY